VIGVAATSSERPTHLQGLTDEQVALYYRMLKEVSGGRGDYWTCLDGLDAADADKYAVADALGATTEARKYAARAGIEITHTYDTDQGELTTTEVAMGDLRVGDRFVQEGVYREGRGVGPVVYEVTEDCATNARGWLLVREVGAEHVWNDRDQAWSDEGFFAYSPDTLMNRVASR
jgi:hypothetical protein